MPGPFTEVPGGRRVRTADGDVLDEVCWRYYGHPDAVPAVLAANPGLADQLPVLPAGLALFLPDLALDGTESLPGSGLWNAAPASPVLPEQ